MIPKIIHYCWFGKNPLPKLAKQCIESWKKQCPDYQIKEWNESNSPVHLFPFAEQALKAGKWAFVSDVIRLYALYTEGGVYMDTDVELIKPLDAFLDLNNFTGYEKDCPILQTAIFGSEPHDSWIGDCLEKYKELTFSPNRACMSVLVNNRILTQILKDKGVVFDGKPYSSDYVHIYPWEYFCPMSYGTHYIEKTEKTVCIHYYTFSWSEPETFKGHVKKFVVKYIGDKKFRAIVNAMRKTLRLR